MTEVTLNFFLMTVDTHICFHYIDIAYFIFLHCQYASSPAVPVGPAAPAAPVRTAGPAGSAGAGGPAGPVRTVSPASAGARNRTGIRRNEAGTCRARPAACTVCRRRRGRPGQRLDGTGAQAGRRDRPGGRAGSGPAGSGRPGRPACDDRDRRHDDACAVVPLTPRRRGRPGSGPAGRGMTGGGPGPLSAAAGSAIQPARPAGLSLGTAGNTRLSSAASTRTRPDVGLRSASSISSDVDLPAPFGPRNATVSPAQCHGHAGHRPHRPVYLAHLLEGHDRQGSPPGSVLTHSIAFLDISAPDGFVFTSHHPGTGRRQCRGSTERHDICQGVRSGYAGSWPLGRGWPRQWRHDEQRHRA